MATKCIAALAGISYGRMQDNDPPRLIIGINAIAINDSNQQVLPTTPHIGGMAQVSFYADYNTSPTSLRSAAVTALKAAFNDNNLDVVFADVEKNP